MKFFRKKNRPSLEIKSRPEPEQSFYSRYADDTSLDEYSAASGAQQTRRTSKHSPAQRRETNNRASSWTLALLLLRAVLIVLLLVGGFFVLKRVLTRLAEPSEKKQQQWEDNELLMQKASGSMVESVSVPKQVVDAVGIQQQLDQWERAERSFRSAEALSRRGMNDDAIQQLSQALQSSPDHQSAQKLLLDIYMKKEMFADAIPLCIRLLNQNSQQQDLQMDLLIALQSSGQADAGLILANRILLDQPSNQAVLSIAAAGQVTLGNIDAALALFTRMLEIDDKNKDALTGCGSIYFNQGDYEQAVPYFLELVRMDPAPEYYKTLALCYAQQNQSGKTVIFMGQASSLFGGGVVFPWLRDPGLDLVRESVDFRSFADRLVGAETRKAIEAINRREAEKAPTRVPGGLELPQQPKLNSLQPGR